MEHSGRMAQCHHPIVISIEMFALVIIACCLIRSPSADGTAQLLHICQRHINDANRPFLHSQIRLDSDVATVKSPWNTPSFPLTFIFTEKSLSRSWKALETSRALWHCCIVPPDVTQVRRSLWDGWTSGGGRDWGRTQTKDDHPEH